MGGAAGLVVLAVLALVIMIGIKRKRIRYNIREKEGGWGRREGGEGGRVGKEGGEEGGGEERGEGRRVGKEGGRERREVSC